MIDESMDKEQMAKPPQPWEFRSKPAWQRLIIMLGGVTVNLILGFFIFMMIQFHWGKNVLPVDGLPNGLAVRSEERRVGKECSTRMQAGELKRTSASDTDDSNDVAV